MFEHGMLISNFNSAATTVNGQQFGEVFDLFSISIKQRLGIGFAVMVLLSAAGSGLGWWISGKTRTATRQMIDVNITQLKSAQNADNEMQAAYHYVTEFLLSRNPDRKSQIHEHIQSAQAQLNLIRKLVNEDAKRKVIDRVLAESSDYIQLFDQIYTYHEQRGLTHKSGLEGALRTAVHHIESTVNSYQLPDLTVLVLMCRRHEKDYMLRGDPKYLKDIQDKILTFKLMMMGKDIPADEREKIKEQWDQYYKGVSDIVQIDKQIAEAKEQLAATEQRLSESVSAIRKEALAQIDSRGSRVMSLLANSQQLMLFVLCAAVGFGVIVALLIMRSIVLPLKLLVARFKDISEGEGDLTQRVEFHSRRDELGEVARAFNRFLDDLRQLIANARSTTDIVANAAHEIASSNEQMSISVNQQGRQMVEVAAAIEEMSATAQLMTEQSEATTTCAGDARELAVDGGQTVEKTIQGMQRISESVSVTSQSISRLGEHGQQIGQIINVINDIADQTNLLALNAAIEAARAGQHGRGFAVVANEVRKLADRTTQATSEIAQSIQLIQDETTQAVSRIKMGTNEVSQGVQMAQQAGESLNRIVQRASDVSRDIQQLAAGSQEQAQTASSISRNVESITQMASQSNAAVAAAVKATTSLSAQALELQQSIGRFKI